MKSKYHIIQNEQELQQLIDACKQTKYASCDFETSGDHLYNRSFYPTILSVTFQPGTGCSIPLKHFEMPKKHPWKSWLIKFGREVVENPEITKIGWNWKFDNQIFVKYGIYARGTVIDAMLAKYILNENRPNGLKEMVKRYLPDFADYEKALEDDDGNTKVQWDKIPLEELCKYGCLDTDCTFRLGIFFEKRLMDLKMYNILRNLYMPMSRVAQDIEKNGLYLDREFNQHLLETYRPKIDKALENIYNLPRIQKLQKQYTQERIENYLEQIQNEIDELDPDDPKNARKISTREQKIANIRAGVFTTKKEQELNRKINLGSPIDLPWVMYEAEHGFQFPVLKNSDKGKPSTDEETLVNLRMEVKKPDSPKAIFLDSLLELRGLQKMYKTYIEGWSEKVQDDNRLHGTYLIHGTTSGRWSCVSEDTLVLTNVGEISIKELPEYMGHEGELKTLTQEGWKSIEWFIYKGKYEMYEVTLEDGKTIQCTLDHKFITNQGAKKLRDLKLKDTLLRLTEGKRFKEVSITQIRPIGIKGVYDLSIEGCPQYVGNGILNHNSKEPNMQQIPKTSVDPNIKKQLVAKPGTLYFVMDYSQAELRIMAHLSGDETYLEAFAKGQDPHLAIAAQKYGVPYEEAEKIYNNEEHPDYKLWKTRRKQAKQIVFGLIYGIQAKLLSVKLSDPKSGLIVTPEEAQQMQDEFFEQHPKIRKYMAKQERILRKNGYITSLFGTKRRLPEVYSEDNAEAAYAIRLAVNFPCQGAASHMTQFGAILVYWDMKQGKYPPMDEVATVHDALYYNTKPEYINTWTVWKIWDTLRNPLTKKYFGFQIDDVTMSMDVTIGRTMAEELPFIPGYDYNKMLQPDFDVDAYMEEHKKFKGIDISEYPKRFPELFEQGKQWKKLK